MRKIWFSIVMKARTGLILVALNGTSHFALHVTTDERSVVKYWMTDTKFLLEEYEQTVESSANMSLRELMILSGRSLIKTKQS